MCPWPQEPWSSPPWESRFLLLLTWASAQVLKPLLEGQCSVTASPRLWIETLNLIAKVSWLCKCMHVELWHTVVNQHSVALSHSCHVVNVFWHSQYARYLLMQLLTMLFPHTHSRFSHNAGSWSWSRQFKVSTSCVFVHHTSVAIVNVVCVFSHLWLLKYRHLPFHLPLTSLLHLLMN